MRQHQTTLTAIRNTCNGSERIRNAATREHRENFFKVCKARREAMWRLKDFKKKTLRKIERYGKSHNHLWKQYFEFDAEVMLYTMQIVEEFQEFSGNMFWRRAFNYQYLSYVRIMKLRQQLCK